MTQLDRAEEFRGPQRVLALTNLALIGRRAGADRAAAAAPDRATALARGRPYRTAAAAGAALSVALALVTLPLGGGGARAGPRRRAGDAGLGRLAAGTWPRARRSAPLFAAAGGGAAARAGAPLPAPLVDRRRRRGRRHLGACSRTCRRSCSTRSSTSSRRCREGQLRSDVLEPGASAPGVDVGEVYRIDASRRTTASNAYVTGIGAHEAGRALRQPDRALLARPGQLDRRPRARPREAPRRPARPAVGRDRGARRGVFLIQRLSERWAPPEAQLGEGRGTATALAVPVVALALGLVSLRRRRWRATRCRARSSAAPTPTRST